MPASYGKKTIISIHWERYSIPRRRMPISGILLLGSYQPCKEPLQRIRCVLQKVRWSFLFFRGKKRLVKYIFFSSLYFSLNVLIYCQIANYIWIYNINKSENILNALTKKIKQIFLFHIPHIFHRYIFLLSELFFYIEYIHHCLQKHNPQDR